MFKRILQTRNQLKDSLHNLIQKTKNDSNSTISPRTNNNSDFKLKNFKFDETYFLMKNTSQFISPHLIQINKKFHSSNPTQPPVPKKKTKANWKDFMSHIYPMFNNKKAKQLLFFSLVVTIASKVLVTMSPYFLKIGINSVIDKDSIYRTVGFIALFSLSRIVGGTINEYRQILLNKLSTIVILDFTKKMMGYLMKMEVYYFKNNSQKVLSKFEKSLRGLESINRFLLGHIFSNVIEFLMISGMLLTCCGTKYFLNTFFIYAVYFGATKIISNKRNALISERLKRELDAESKLSDIVYNIDNVKYFQKETKEINLYTKLVNLVRIKSDESQMSLSKLNAAQNIIITIGLSTNLLMGIFDCYSGTLTPGDLVMLQAIFNQIMLPLNFMGMLMREFDETRVNLGFAIEMINNENKLNFNKTYVPFEFKGGKIEFQNVEYSYSNKDSNSPIHKKVLNKLNLTFEAGTINALVGHSGIGKSTIFNLIYKLIDTNSGEILIDGQKINDLEISSLRKHLSICPQNGHLFNDTILNNILYGNEDTSMEEVIEICKNINLHDVIMKFPEQYNTNVGSLGSKLSGGEKQRILVARVLIRKSDILLFDEPTSNLDSENDKLIMDYIFSRFPQKTIIICAHKLNTIIRSDKIHVMNNGIVQESGSHNELFSNQKSMYYELFKNHYQ